MGEGDKQIEYDNVVDNKVFSSLITSKAGFVLHKIIDK